MKDVEKHVIHWINQAEDLVTSDILIKQKREVQGMFFCHLAVEKALKSHIIKITKDHPIRIHQLSTLAERANITLRSGDTQFFGILMNYQNRRQVFGIISGIIA